MMAECIGDDVPFKLPLSKMLLDSEVSSASSSDGVDVRLWFDGDSKEGIWVASDIGSVRSCIGVIN